MTTIAELFHLAEEGLFQKYEETLNALMKASDGISSTEIINTTDYSGNSALHLSSSHNQAQMTEFLLKRGADPLLQNSLGQTPLHCALVNDSVEAVKAILKHTKGKKNLEEQSNSVLSSPLHSACAAGSLVCIELLIKEGFKTNVVDGYGNTIIHKCVFENHLECAQYLHEVAGVDIDIPNNENKTPLHKAVEQGHLDFVQYLINKKAEINRADKQMNLPIHIAANRGMYAMCKYLIEQGADMSSHNINGDTPLHLAALAIASPHFGSSPVDAIDSELYPNTPGNQGLIVRFINYLIDHGGIVTSKNYRGKVPGILAPGPFASLFSVEEIKRRHEEEALHIQQEEESKKEEAAKKLQEDEQQKIREEELRKLEEKKRKEAEEERKLEAERNRLKEEEERRKKEEERKLGLAKRRKRRTKKNEQRGGPTVARKPKKKSSKK